MTGRAVRTVSDAGESAPLRVAAARVRRDIGASVGHPLDGALRERMEARVTGTEHILPVGAARGFHGLEAAADRAAGEDRKTEGRTTDFSAVRLHADGHSASAARRLGASAFTIGEHVYLDPARVPAGRTGHEGLMAHELAHVVQQRQLGRALLQPRLIATGTAADIERFIVLVEPAIGEDLEFDPATNQINAVATLATPATSPALATALHQIMDDPLTNAEALFGTAQPRVAVGAFPNPNDMTVSTVQRIDMDDVEAIEAGAPGSGVAKLAHELTENYTAQTQVPVAGVNLFEVAHEEAVRVESDVAEELVGAGRRVAEVSTPFVANVRTRVQDFQTYFLVFTITRTPATSDMAISNARRAPRVNVSSRVIDSYASGSDVAPPAAAAEVAAAAADVAANPTATVLVEGFTDDVGTEARNRPLSNDRAARIVRALVASGVGAGRIHGVGRAAASPVAPNTTDANRARNRRVVITVDRPGP
jgi:outer membrane protein OmpA-like peptidoglycan-associated protein